MSNWSRRPNQPQMGFASDVLKVPPDVEEGRRSRPAVQVLVGAPHGEVGPGPGEGDRHGADGVRQVPEREGARPMRERRDRRHVVHERRAVRRVREGHERRVPVDRARERVLGHREPVLGLHDHQAMPLAQEVDRPLQHVEVRGEVHLVGDDGPAARPGPERRHHELEEIDRRGVRHDDVGRSRPDQRRELRADPLAGGEPSLAPPPDQPAAPLALDRLPEPRTRLPWQAPERVAVEVNQPRIADDELTPEAGERVGRIEAPRLGERVSATGAGSAASRRAAAGGVDGVRWRRRPPPCPRGIAGPPAGLRPDVSRDAGLRLGAGSA